MEKTKVGISVAAAAAILYVTVVSGSVLALLLLAGYILLKEDNAWLRWNAVKAVAFWAVFQFIISAVGLAPDVIDIIGGIAKAFTNVKPEFVYQLDAFFGNGINGIIVFIRDLCALVLAFKSYKMSSVKVPVVDDVAQKSIS